jgi:hypothetical protein
MCIVQGTLNEKDFGHREPQRYKKPEVIIESRGVCSLSVALYSPPRPSVAKKYLLLITRSTPQLVLDI